MKLFLIDLPAAAFAHTVLSEGGIFLHALMRLITLSGNGGALFIAIGIALLIPRRTRGTGALTLLSLAAGALLTNVLLKNIIARERPFADPASPFYAYWRAAGSLAASGASFPSGHTTAAAAFAAALFVRCDKKISWTAFAIPLLMGFSRIYFGVHYASDVLAGFGAGLAACLAAMPLARAAERIPFFRPLPPHGLPAAAEPGNAGGRHCRKGG